MSKDELLSFFGLLVAFTACFLLLKLFTKFTRKDKEKGYQEWPHLKLYGITLFCMGMMNAAKEILERYVLDNPDQEIMDFIYQIMIGLFTSITVVLLVLRLIASIKSRKGYSEKEYKNVPFYFEKDKKLKMRGSCSTFNRTLNIIASSMCVLLGAATAYLVVKGTTSFNLFLYCYSIIFVQLLANFFDGEVDVENVEDAVGNIGTIKQKEFVWKNLNDEYAKLWPDKMLGMYTIRKHNKNDKEDEVSFQDMMCQIIAGRNLIIDNSMILQFTDMLLAIINILFSSNKKILFLCDDVATTEACYKWINTLKINKDVATTAIRKLSYDDVQTTVAIGNDIDILIGTVDLMLKTNTPLNKADVVIGINIDKILTYDSINLSMLCATLSTSKERQIQFLLFGKIVKNLIPAISQIFMIKDFDFNPVNISSIDEFTANFWGSDKGWFQSNIMPGFGSSFMGQLYPIAIPALKEEISDICVVSGDEPIEDNKNALMMSQQMIKGYLGDKAISNLSNTINVYDKNNFMSLTDKSVVVVPDSENTVAGCLHDWMKYIKEDMCLNIVSKDYLLRDYIVSNIDYFVGNVNTVSALMPMYHDNIKSTVYKLINELCNSGVFEDRLINTLQATSYLQVNDPSKVNQAVIEQALSNLTYDALHEKVGFGSYMKREEVADPSTKYTAKVKYSLIPNVRQELPRKFFSNIRFIDVEKSAKVLKQVPYFELYQNYLEGKKVSFEGRSYTIKDINPINGTVQLLANTSIDNYIYRDIKKVQLDNLPSWKLKGNYLNQNIGSTNINISILEGTLSVVTTGYLEFRNKVNLQDGYYYENDLSEKKNDYLRKYYRNDVIRLSIGNDFTRRNSKDKNDKVAITLSLLLNEMFKTLLPDLNQYIIARAVTSDEPKSLSKIEEVYSPIVQKELYNEKMVTILLLEDTDLPKGIAEKIIDSFKDIVDLLNDYLKWLETPEENCKRLLTDANEEFLVSQIDKYSFLKFGGDEYNAEALDGVRELLAEMSYQNELTKSREEFIARRKDKEKVENAEKEKTKEKESKTEVKEPVFEETDKKCPVCGSKLFYCKVKRVYRCNKCQKNMDLK